VDDRAVARRTPKMTYPRTCEVLVPAREPAEREHWIDLRPVL